MRRARAQSPRAEPPRANVLLVDIGNTRIKWAVWRNGRLGRMQADVYAGWSSGEFAQRIFRGEAALPARIVVASVARAGIHRRLTAAARQIARAASAPGGAVEPELIATSRSAAGVSTRYSAPWRLGVDRFLGVIAAHHLAGTRGACVINIGTAVTIDLVDGRGMHHGGVIVPGPRLMTAALLRGTAGIAKRAQRPPGREARGGARIGTRAARILARDTATAIEEGASLAVAAAVERAVEESRTQLGTLPLVILTGGGATDVRRLIRLPLVEVPDLVLRGIALHAGLDLR